MRARRRADPIGAGQQYAVDCICGSEQSGSRTRCERQSDLVQRSVCQRPASALGALRRIGKRVPQGQAGCRGGRTGRKSRRCGWVAHDAPALPGLRIGVGSRQNHGKQVGGKAAHEFRFLRRTKAAARRGAEIPAREDARRRRCAPSSKAEPYDKALWKELAEMGWLGTAIPEEYGGARPRPSGTLRDRRGTRPRARAGAVLVVGLSRDRSHPAAGSDAQKKKLAAEARLRRSDRHAGDGRGPGNADARSASSHASTAASSTARKLPVPDGDIADFAVVVARTGRAGDARLSLALVDLKGAGVKREAVETDRSESRSHARTHLQERNRRAARRRRRGWDALLKRVLDRAAVLMAFEQVGGADACAGDGAATTRCNRYAFGRPIGSFQAIKHKLADMYVANELARSNCYYGAWALSTNAAGTAGSRRRARVSARRGLPHCRQGEHPDPWRHGLHLGVRLPPLLPPRQAARRSRSAASRVLERPADQPRARTANAA